MENLWEWSSSWVAAGHCTVVTNTTWRRKQRDSLFQQHTPHSRYCTSTKSETERLIVPTAHPSQQVLYLYQQWNREAYCSNSTLLIAGTVSLPRVKQRDSLFQQHTPHSRNLYQEWNREAHCSNSTLLTAGTVPLQRVKQRGSLFQQRTPYTESVYIID